MFANEARIVDSNYRRLHSTSFVQTGRFLSFYKRFSYFVVSRELPLDPGRPQSFVISFDAISACMRSKLHRLPLDGDYLIA